MSFVDPNAFYLEELLLLDKNQDTPTPITEGLVVNGDLTPFRHRMEAVNTGNQLQNNGVLTLRIPPDGTFVRKEPILIEENAKDAFIIQFQMKQDKDRDGIFEEEGKLFRFFIGQPTLQDDEHVGETLKINLIPVEYRTRETLDAERFVFRTPRNAFIRRITAYNDIKGIDNTQLIFTVLPEPGSIKLPDADSLKQEWRPLAPRSTHDLLREIVERQSLAGVEGGVFEDFFFDYDPVPAFTKAVTLKAEAEGTVDSGVILDPLVFENADTQKDTNINVDLIKFKNNIILEGNPLGGSLPMEHVRFSSTFEHAKQRPEWDPTRSYTNGANNTNQSEVRITDPFLDQIRFFKAIKTTGNLNINPTSDTNREEFWEEDFVTIPDYNRFASYEGKPSPNQRGDIVVQIGIGGIDRFYEAIQDVPNNPQDDIQFRPQPGGTSFWADTGVTFLRGAEHPLVDPTVPTGLDRIGRTQFFSYTPWTEDFQAMRATTLFGIEDSVQEANFASQGYQGVVPDWNYVRAGFDRVTADDRFELVSGKSVIKTLSNLPVREERYVGARYLVSSSPSGTFAGQANKIAEWSASTDFLTSTSVDNWRFSRAPVDGDTIVHQARGVLLKFDTASNQWVDLWNILDTPNPGGLSRFILKDILSGALAVTGILISLLFKPEEFGSSTRHSPLHICKDIKLVAGSSGIPGQAFELRYDWQTLGEFGGDKKNFNSIGAWWYMAFPYPKISTFGRDVGDLYQNPVIDSNNLDKNHEGIFGWNEGLNSEDLGRIQTASFKTKLSLFGSTLGTLVIGYHDMPMILWAVDIFDRVWFADFKQRRNGEYSLQKISFGENAVRQLHYGRYDELLKLFDIVLDFNWLLREKEFTGIEFDWRFVKTMGMFYKVGYNSQGLYVANQFPDYVSHVASQFAGQAFPFEANLLFPGEDYNPNDIIVNDARLAIDEFHFEKQLFVSSDDVAVNDARTILDHEGSVVDYLDGKIRALASRERKKFVEQAWFMQAHGDVRMRFGEKFTATGPRVPGGTQDLICNEVKHIIDSDGYMMQITGKRKFIFS